MNIKLDNGQELEISRVPLGKYADILEKLQAMFETVKLDELQDLRGITNEQFLKMIPGLIKKHLPDVISIMPLVTPLTEEQVQNLSIGEFTDIIYAVWVVNNYSSVIDKLKKFAAQRKQTAPAVSAPQS